MKRTMAVVVLAAFVSLALGVTAFAQELEVALIADPGGRREAEGAQQYFERMERVLRRGGLAYSVVTQDQMLAGALHDYRVAIVPFAPNLSNAGRAMLRSFCSDGGKVMCFYTTYGLERELGLRSIRYVPSGDDRTLFRHVRLRAGVLPGISDGFDQTSWNIQSPAPGPDTLVLADWVDVNGEDSGHIAVTLSDGGLFFSHVLLAEGEGDETRAGQMLRAAARYLEARAGTRKDIAIIYGTVSESAGGSDSRLVGRMVGEMERILDGAGLPYAILTDEAVAAGALEGRRVAILP
ncbi:MAG: hypothetical protein KAX19_06710, partial [Candidatus Brocadiae bacterium]|nr:hypothetical protein [Candidatus Brocadiia bacterium]